MADINPYVAPNSKLESAQILVAEKHILPKLLLFALLPFSAIVLLVDWFGVRVIQYNGLGFHVHVYSFGATFAVAAVVSFLFLRKNAQASLLKAILLSTIVASVWWFLTFILLFYCHGLFGGWY